MKDVRECEECHAKISYVQAYIVFNKRTQKQYAVCPNCITKLTKVQVDDTLKKDAPFKLAPATWDEMKDELDKWHKSLKNI